MRVGKDFLDLTCYSISRQPKGVGKDASVIQYGSWLARWWWGPNWPVHSYKHGLSCTGAQLTRHTEGAQAHMRHALSTGTLLRPYNVLRKGCASQPHHMHQPWKRYQLLCQLEKLQLLEHTVHYIFYIQWRPHLVRTGVPPPGPRSQDPPGCHADPVPATAHEHKQVHHADRITAPRIDTSTAWFGPPRPQSSSIYIVRAQHMQLRPRFVEMRM